MPRLTLDKHFCRYLYHTQSMTTPGYFWDNQYLIHHISEKREMERDSMISVSLKIQVQQLTLLPRTSLTLLSKPILVLVFS